VAAVVALLVVLVVVKLTSGGGAAVGGNASGSGRGAPARPSIAPPALVRQVAEVPSSVFDAVGTSGNPPPFTVASHQRLLGSGGRPEVVYVGAEYCPYCALLRYSLVAALGRFGTFPRLATTVSGDSDGRIPTFSFYGSSYSSPYLAFTPVEEYGRSEPPRVLEPLSKRVSGLLERYERPPFASSQGIPFLDIGNRYLAVGVPRYLATLFYDQTTGRFGPLDDGGPGRSAIASAVHAPASPLGRSIDAAAFIVEANYVSAAICSLDGSRPKAVCGSSGVRKAALALAAERPVG
jgi:hypothetical protein